MQFMKRFARKDEAQGLVEYGIIIGLVSVATIGILGTMAGDLNTVFNTISNTLGTV